MKTLRRSIGGLLLLLVVGHPRVGACPTTFSLSALTPQPCQYEPIVLELSGNESTVTYTLLANGSPLNGVTQSVVNGRRRFVVTGGLGNGTYTFSVQATLDTCTITMGNATVIVYTPAVPTLSLSSLNQILCYGDPGIIVVLNTDPQASYTVRDGNTIVAGPTQGNGGQIQFVLPASLFPQSGMKTFSVRATALGNSQCYAETANGPLDGATFIVYGLPPAPQISAPQPYACSPGGNARVLVQNAVAGYVYQVLDGNTAVYSVLSTTTGTLDITTIPVTPASPGLGFGTRSVTVVAINPNNNNCRIQSTSSVTITVVTRPATPLIATGTSTQVYCDASGGATAYAIIANGEVNVTYEVRRVGSNALVASAAGQSGVVTIPITGLTASGSPHQFRVYAVSTLSGCSSDPSTTLTVVVNPSPTVTASVQGGGSSAQLCAGYSMSVTLTGNSSGAVTFQWLLNGTSIPGATTSTYTVPTGLGVGTYLYQLRVTNSFGCSAVSSPISIFVTGAPSVAIAAGGTTALCAGYSSGPTLTSSVSGCTSTATYQWHVNGNPISGATNATYVIPTSQTGTKNYTVKVTDAGGCEKFSNVICVTVVPTPTVSLSTASTQVCPGTQITVYFTFSGCGPWYLTYKINNGSNITVQTSSNPYILTYTITQPTTFTVVSIQNCIGCSGTISGPSSLTVSPFGIPTSYFVMGFTGDTVTTNSNGYVLGWPNYAGDGSNYPDGTVNASSDANRPKHYPNYSALNGHGAIYWDGNDQPVQVQVNTGSGISGGTQKTLFIVYRPTSTSLSNNRMVIYKHGDENHGLAIYLINRQVYYGAWNNQNCSGSCTNKWAVFQSTGFTVQPGTNYIFQFVYNGNASSSNRLRFSINGNVYTPSGTPGTSMSYSGDAVSIGGKVGNTRFHDFASVNETNQYLCDNTKIAEVLLYNTADASLRDQVWCVLKYMYGFTNLGNNPIGVLSKDSGNDEGEPIAGEPRAPAEEVTLSPVAPNPSELYATAVLTVSRQQYVEVSILSLDGRVHATVFAGYVARGERREFTIDVGTLPSGVYVLNVYGEYFVRSERFVVQH